MRSLVFATLVAATALPGFAYAAPSEIHQDRREIRQGQREVQRDMRRGDWREAREDRRELREDRRELREDWRDYRAHNREIYRRPAYVGPRGYRYQAWRPGVRIPAAYYSPRYVIADPWHYRLNRPAGNLRWVRYGNDVMLVDTRSGYIRDVIRDFFW